MQQQLMVLPVDGCQPNLTEVDQLLKEVGLHVTSKQNGEIHCRCETEEEERAYMPLGQSLQVSNKVCGI